MKLSTVASSLVAFAASSLFLATSTLATPVALPRAGAPSSSQMLDVTNLTECGTAVVSWTGPGVPPYDLTVGQGAFLYGPGAPLASYANLTTSPFLWNVSKPANDTLYFTLKDARGQITYVQGLVVGEALNGTLACSNATAVAVA